MPPRIDPSTRAITSVLRCERHLLKLRPYATSAAATTVLKSQSNPHPVFSVASKPHPITQPPSYKPPEFRKSQLLRQYASLIRSTPLMLLFQHNNLKSTEWVGIRRELLIALRKVDDARAAMGHPPENISDGVKIQIVQTGIFAAALKIVEFFKADGPGASTHTLSPAVYETVSSIRRKHPLNPLLSGPLVLVTFPTVSPEHLKAVLSNLSPNLPQFPPPTRRANPGWHDNAVQMGLQKLLLLGARVEGRVFDVEGVRWVGGIEGGMEGLRSQLVHLLTGIGAGVTRTLEGVGRSLWITVEGRRSMLEEEQGQSKEGSKEQDGELKKIDC